MNSNIIEAFASRPLYMQYSPSKIRTMMACHAWMVLTRCCQKKETAYQVVSCSSSKFTFHVFYYQQQDKEVIGRTLVCVSIHLECWLNKARVEIVTWAAVGVANQQQFSYNSVSRFWQCEHDRCGFNSHLMRIG